MDAGEAGPYAVSSSWEVRRVTALISARCANARGSTRSQHAQPPRSPGRRELWGHKQVGDAYVPEAAAVRKGFGRRAWSGGVDRARAAR
jgi:hypothetical protein